MAFMTYLILQSAKPDMSLLFSQLEPAEGAKIMDRLESMGIQVEARGDGSQIYVPTDKVARIRMDLANAGLPSSGSLGYEIFDKADILGASSAIMDINHARALEGEIAKSIRSIQGVAGARVHLVVPKKELFTKDRQSPSASIVVKMNRGRLSGEQVAGVQHLVAAAVPGLTAERITIIDDKGNLLARQSESGAFDLGNHNEMRRGYEQRLSNSVEALLEKTLGMGKSRVEVSADMDFDKITINTEEFNPEGQVVRSTNTATEDGQHSESGSEGAVTVANALPDKAAAEGAGGSKAQHKNNRNEENTVYDNSKVFKTHIKQSGMIKRLSVAVLVDGNYKDGKYEERSKEELDKITTLVKTSMGFNADRGDVVEVVNMPFAPIQVEDKPLSMVENILSTVSMGHVLDVALPGLIGLLALFLFVRPFAMRTLEQIRKFAPPSQEGQVFSMDNGYPNQGVSGLLPGQPAIQAQPQALQAPAAPLEPMKPSPMQQMREMIDKHPEETVSVIRNWMATPQQGGGA